MFSKSANLAKACYWVAAFVLFGETLFGCIAVLGIGFDTAKDILVDLSLTLAFPIFLISIWRKRLAVVGLWIFFVAQWIGRCTIINPPALFSPVGDFHDDALFLGIALVTISYIFHRADRPVNSREDTAA